MMKRRSYSTPMLPIIIYLCLLLPTKLVIANSPVSQSNCDDTSQVTSPQPLAKRKNSHQNFAHLIGLFDVHEGNRCHLLRPGGMEQVLMTIAVFENGLARYESNISNIGFEIYDSCSSTALSLQHLIYALSDAKALAPNCGRTHFIGVIGPKNAEIQTGIQSFLASLNIHYVPLTATSLRDETKAITQVLYDLRWKMVVVFTSTLSLEKEFREEADKHNICISSFISVLPNERSESYIRMKLHEVTATGVQVAVVLGSGINIRELYETVLMTNSTLQYWLLAGVDSTEDDMFPLLPPDHPVIIFRKPNVQIPMFDAGFEDTYEFGEKIKQLNLVQSYIEYMNSCKKDISGNVLNDSRCGDQLRHSSLQKTIVEESVDQLLENMVDAAVLKKFDNNDSEYSIIGEADQSSTGIEIWTYQHAVAKYSKHKEMQVGHYLDGHLNWDKKILNIFRAMGSGWFKIPEFYCQQNCQEVCYNFDNISTVVDLENLFNRIYHWKQDTWVNVLLTISCVGIIVALLTAIFLIINSCREDFDEGSQLSNIIVLAAIILSYCCTGLFMFHKDSITCYRRLTVVGVAYVCVLAPILSRCFLLIAAEMDGIHAHVSGFLQVVICFFITSVQVAMAGYFWLSHESIRSSKYKCVFDAKSTLGYLSYPMLISFIWLVTSPFCAKSRRNNREGLLLHLGSFAVCFVWLIWYLLFFLLHPRWNEFTICFGMVATVTAIIIVIFMPKVYKMVVSAAAKQHGQVSMQPVIFASTSSRSPNLSIYESVNHGFNPDKDGFVVDVFRDDDDSPRPRKMTHL